MCTMALIEKLGRRLRGFRKAEGGQVLMTFALATIPMIGFIGAAIDYSRGNSAKAAIQAAADATALMLSRAMPTPRDGTPAAGSPSLRYRNCCAGGPAR